MQIISKKEAKKKGLIHYFTGKPCKRGHICERYVKGSTCVLCHNLTSKQRYDKWINSLDLKELFIKRNVYSAKFRAKRLGVEYNICEDDINIPEYCPYLGIKLEFHKNHKDYNSPSLDRIDNTKGYTKDNVIIVSVKANTIKNNASFRELETLVNNLRRTIENQFVDYGAYI